MQLMLRHFHCRTRGETSQQAFLSKIYSHPSFSIKNQVEIMRACTGGKSDGLCVMRGLFPSSEFGRVRKVSETRSFNNTSKIHSRSHNIHSITCQTRAPKHTKHEHKSHVHDTYSRVCVCFDDVCFAIHDQLQIPRVLHHSATQNTHNEQTQGAERDKARHGNRHTETERESYRNSQRK